MEGKLSCLELEQGGRTGHVMNVKRKEGSAEECVVCVSEFGYCL